MAKKNKDEVLTIDHANQAMRELDKIDALLAKFSADEAATISKARAKYHSGDLLVKRQVLENRKQELGEIVKEYATKDRKLWKKKSVTTPFGVFGFRDGKDSVILIKKTAKTFAEALELIRNAKTVFIRRVEELDKDRILSAYKEKYLSNEYLARFGLKVESGERFFAKTTSAKDLKKAMDELKSA